ncbi:hypothetical protein EJ03DRAFT_271909 [Teratosphaeria nubilosa]|uniref:Peptide N-acetyl-beta-D-glucosaminyl asparaginase amidase A N-terminal domain-containing protein n=1 Tax=Teratosphaeria nubilosa TaxID=161662 RepID=A0A6G1LB02_9PEZI|nr:hypothetical protein EJ03DRAFT_271909 [Teratosphaeria nubilosa]
MLLITSVFITRCQATAAVGKYQHYARAVANSLLEVFEVYPPVLTVTPIQVLEITDGSSDATIPIVDPGRPTCQETLAVHVFASSFGAPYVGNYKPPSCDFNRVSWNLTVTSAGRQFDRLGIVYLGDTEVFRTSTAQPTTKGIEWTYIKDMTNYLPLFKQDQKIIFDLGNLINDIYTGTFNVTLTSAFFTADDSITPADLILPVSGRQSSSNQGSVFSVPTDNASNDLTLPRNVKKAVFTIAATGQSEEEFWWSNVLQSDINTFPDSGALYGFSPFREVQLLIDGNLAGVAWPFPIIFTGGVVPGFWRPIVGVNAFDLKEDEIDITPWLPLLCDGNAHSFTIRVSGLNDSGDGSATLSDTTGSYWWVTGKVFLWLDEKGHITTGQGPDKIAPTPKFEVTSTIGKMRNGSNETLVYQVTAQRSLSFKSTINLSSGSKTAFWSQELSFSNFGNLSDQGNVATTQQQTTGHDVSSSGYARQIGYPLYAYTVVTRPQGNTTIVGTVNRGKEVQTFGEPVFPTGLESFSAAEAIHDKFASFQGAFLNTSQQGNAYFTQNSTLKASFGYGSTEQDMVFSGVSAVQNGNDFPTITGSNELFHRHVAAVNGSVTEDQTTLIGGTVEHPHGTPEFAYTFALAERKQGYGRVWHGLK